VKKNYGNWSAFAKVIVTRSSADAEKAARCDPEGGKVSATGWPLTAVSYVE